MHELIANIQGNGWAVHFLETDCRTRVGPWLLLDTHERVLMMLSRVHVRPENMVAHHEHIRAWGVDSLHFHMTDQQYADLVAAGMRDQRTAYDKRRDMERVPR